MGGFSCLFQGAGGCGASLCLVICPQKNVLVAANKVSSKVSSVSFSDDSSYFVTAGNRHVKFWYLDHSKTSKVVPLAPALARCQPVGDGSLSLVVACR